MTIKIYDFIGKHTKKSKNTENIWLMHEYYVDVVWKRAQKKMLNEKKLSAGLSVVARMSSESGVREIRVDVEWFDFPKKVLKKVIGNDASER